MRRCNAKIASIVERPYCASVMKFSVRFHSINRLFIIEVKSFPRLLVILIPLLFPGSLVFSFLWRGIITAFDHGACNIPESNILFKKSTKIGSIMSLNSEKYSLIKLSFPAHLWFF